MASTAEERQKWMAAGSDATAQKTYASIQTALKKLSDRRNVEIFLQGSYANSTNIRADSDVDIVVMDTRSFAGSRSRLDEATSRLYDSLPNATYTSEDLKQEVLNELIEYYGYSRVHRKNKCIRVDGNAGYVDADVVPCVEYHWYRYSNSDLTKDYVEGVRISPDEGGQIINYPKEHRKNGAQKNALCLQRYKPTVRQVKRLRNRAQDLGLLRDGVAPGYLLECMVYNVPDFTFIGNGADRLLDVVWWLRSADLTDFKSCDEIHRLFQTDPGNFDVQTARGIIEALWVAL